MCFSATASFVASGVLGTTGAASLKQVEGKKEVMYAGIPLLFAIQQFIEGLLWLYLGGILGVGQIYFTYGFLFFAFILWPVYIPTAIYLIEKEKWRKKVLKWLIVLGSIVSFYLLYFLIVKTPYSGIYCCNNVQYLLNVPFYFVGAVFYVLVVCGSAILSKFKWVRMFGLFVLLSFFASVLFYKLVFVSVWCFFAAVLSVMIIFHFKMDKGR